jgi:hypothetical protein
MFWKKEKIAYLVLLCSHMETHSTVSVEEQFIWGTYYLGFVFTVFSGFRNTAYCAVYCATKGIYMLRISFF